MNMNEHDDLLSFNGDLTGGKWEHHLKNEDLDGFIVELLGANKPTNGTTCRAPRYHVIPYDWVMLYHIP